MSEDYWLCIVKAKDVPDGYDFPMRMSIKRQMSDDNIEYESIFSGWGLPKDFADKLIRVLCMVYPEERNSLMNWLCQTKVGGIIEEDKDIPLQSFDKKPKQTKKPVRDNE